MNQVKIGMFISECRKKQNITQVQLAEKLNITDRAISKWETGKSMPDSSLMLELCEILNITVTDLLVGEVVSMENNKQNEKLLLEMIKQKELTDKNMLRSATIIGLFATIILLLLIMIAALAEIKDWIRVVLVVLGFIIAFVGFFFALKIEQVAGYYQCKKCGHMHVPTYKEVNLAMHMGRTRYLKCPRCNQKSWHKKVIGKK